VSELPAKNWFVALNGEIIRSETAAEIKARILADRGGEFMTRHAVEIEEKFRNHERDHPRAWCAKSKHVPQIKGFGDTPEEAIRDFEDRMKLPGEAPKP
jgi:hypothetical protein